MEQWGSYVLATCSVVGLLVIGRKKTWGWLFNGSAQLLWITFGIITAQYGFIFSGLVFLVVNLYNWLRWTREENDDYRNASKKQAN